MSPSKVVVSDLGRIVTGKTPSTKNMQFFGGDYQFVTPSDLDWKTYYCRSTERTVTDDARKAHHRQFIPANAVMITCIGNTIGKCGISSGDCLTNQQINSIIPHDEIDPRFVYYLLLQNTALIRSIGIGGGSAAPILNKSSFSKIRLLVPPVQQWNAIADILSTYDDLIENNRRRIQLLEQTARLLYKEWFVYLRFPGHEHVKIKDGVPEGWEKKPLSALCTDIRESIHPKDVSPDIPYIGLEHIPRRSVTLNSWGTAGEVDSSKFRFLEGDILFGKIRPYFHKVGFTLLDGITSSDAIVIRPTEKCLYFYVLSLLASNKFIALASKTVREGSKMPRADWNFLLESEFKVPSKAILGLFNEMMNPICSQLRTLALHNRKLGRSRDLFLPRLMSGKVAVS